MSEHNMVVRLPAETLCQLHRLADDIKEPISILVRRWIREAYRARWGESTPPDITTRHGKKIRVKEAAK